MNFLLTDISVRACFMIGVVTRCHDMKLMCLGCDIKECSRAAAMLTSIK